MAEQRAEHHVVAAARLQAELQAARAAQAAAEAAVEPLRGEVLAAQRRATELERAKHEAEGTAAECRTALQSTSQQLAEHEAAQAALHEKALRAQAALDAAARQSTKEGSVEEVQQLTGQLREAEER